ncbi:MAG: transcription/translation regulatory transformer protein RfaH [Pseudomonadota bacterium]
MNWYLIHTKPRQEKCALLNLEQQGYECYLPLLPSEKLRRGALAVADEPLFPRYLFIRLEKGESAKSWSPIRSTRGVSRLVSFGAEPAKVDARLVETLRARENTFQPQRLFTPGERVMLADGAFAGIEAVYQMTDGENRVMVLIELLSKPVRMRVAPASLRKVG